MIFPTSWVMLKKLPEGVEILQNNDKEGRLITSFVCENKLSLVDSIEVSIDKIIKTNIETNWPHTLNQINFQIDRFSVDKSATYNYNNTTVPPEWDELPSATPTPNPLNSEDFYVLFPRKTILPETILPDET
jgi:hypothetical protein